MLISVFLLCFALLCFVLICIDKLLIFGGFYCVQGWEKINRSSKGIFEQLHYTSRTTFYSCYQWLNSPPVILYAFIFMMILMYIIFPIIFSSLYIGNIMEKFKTCYIQTKTSYPNNNLMNKNIQPMKGKLYFLISIILIIRHLIKINSFKQLLCSMLILSIYSKLRLSNRLQSFESR